MVGLDVLTREELAGFDPGVQDTVRELGQVLSPRRQATRRHPRS
jgi:hypothetical protein